MAQQKEHYHHYQNVSLVEMAKKNIRANIISPGFTETSLLNTLKKRSL